MDETRRTAIIVCRDDAHRFLLESLISDSVDHIHRAAGVQDAIELFMRGVQPVLVLLDVALLEDDDAPAAAARLRAIARESIVLEVGEEVEYDDGELNDRLRVNSVEAHDWLELRRA